MKDVCVGNSLVFVNNEEWLTKWVCTAMQHPISVRRNNRYLSCICGGWIRQITEDTADGVFSKVTVDGLRAEITEWAGAANRRHYALTEIRDALALGDMAAVERVLDSELGKKKWWEK